MTTPDIIQSHNGYGWTSTIPNQVTCALLDVLAQRQKGSSLVLDIGAGLGVATLPFLEAGATVIANDLDESHLESIREKATQLGYRDRLRTINGRFPDELGFRDVDFIHCSNVLHFLSGEEIVYGARCMYAWLKPGGRVFIQVGTIYAGHIRRLLPIFEERRRAGVRWAGETDQAREFVLRDFREATPRFMNYLDGPPVIEAFESVGFTILKAWYYTRTGLPALFVNDGREHFGLITKK